MGDVWEDEPVRCDCHSFDHVAWFHLDDYGGFPELSVSLHMNTWRGFWRRLASGVKYIAGIQTKHGNWDEVNIPYARAHDLRAMIDRFIALHDAAMNDEMGEP